MTDLPIEVVLPSLREVLRDRRSAVLQAPPGAGKTTRVPLSLLNEPWLAGGRIVMLEPRRVAARAAARYMARLLGEPIGRTVGYRVRGDTRISRSTRVEVVTEGILTRTLQSDPALEGISLIIFDEFHERSIHADLGLAFSLQARSVWREDLRLLVMSATLDAEPVSELLADDSSPAPILTSEGRTYPVETRYLARATTEPVEGVVADAIRGLLSSESGDVLVFLPGAGEIRRVQQLLGNHRLPRVRVLALHGNLPLEDQDRAIAASPVGERKVVLATSIAETSLTIEGVRVVIDSGLMRIPRFSPRVGMTRLRTVPVSCASADQRRGRAGRVGPGLCLRLWTEAEQRTLLPATLPEIRSADLAPLALELMAWGARDPSELEWLDVPPPAAYSQAMELLSELGAQRGGTITDHGRAMAELGMHPRLAHMIIRGRELGLGSAACEVAAILEERDLLRGDGRVGEADLALRLEALRRRRQTVAGFTVDRSAAERARTLAEQWRTRLGLRRDDAPGAEGLLLAFAYPDRIAQQRVANAPQYLLRNGRGATLRLAQTLSRSPYLAVASVDDRAREAEILLAAPLDLAEIKTYFADQIDHQEAIEWDVRSGAVRSSRIERLGAILLREAPLPDPDPERVVNAVIDGIRREDIGSLPWTAGSRQLQARILFLRRLDPTWPDVSDPALLATLSEWLGPHLWGIRKREQLQRLDLEEILTGLAGWHRRRELNDLAPARLALPGGSKVAIDYTDPENPSVAIRVQEMFGTDETPSVAGGRVPLLLQLLSPAGRPVQVTRDLAGFWRDTYFEVRKDLRGRYPKHFWPDDPLSAEPGRRTKPR